MQMSDGIQMASMRTQKNRIKKGDGTGELAKWSNKSNKNISSKKWQKQKK